MANYRGIYRSGKERAAEEEERGALCGWGGLRLEAKGRRHRAAGEPEVRYQMSGVRDQVSGIKGGGLKAGNRKEERVRWPDLWSTWLNRETG